MATEGIRIEVDDAAVLATLDRIDRLAADPGVIMAAIAGYLVTSTRRHIETERGPDGKWPGLSPRTAAKRIGGGRRRGTANMLRVTGRLYSSITSEATSTEAMVGTNLIYAAIQQLGGTVKQPERQADIFQNYDARTDTFDPRFRKRSKSNFTRRVKVGAHEVTIPPRPYLYVDEQDRAEILQIAEDGFRAEAGIP